MARTPKWAGVVGVDQTGDATSAPSIGASSIYPIGENLNAPGIPHTFERVTSQQPDILSINRSGIDHSFAFDGMQVNCEEIGKWFALALGGDSYAATVHTITPQASGLTEYFGFGIDRGPNLASTNPTMVAVGAKIGSISIEQPNRDYAKMSVGGLFTDLDTPTSGLSVTVPTGDDEQPISFQSLQSGSGFFKTSIDGGAVADRNQMSSFKFDYSRELVYAGMDVASSQPGAILEGGREVTFEWTEDFNEDSVNLYSAWASEQDVALDIRWDVGTWYARIEIAAATITNSVIGEAGAGAEPIMATFQCKAKKTGSNLLTVYTSDDTVATYW